MTDYKPVIVDGVERCSGCDCPQYDYLYCKAANCVVCRGTLCEMKILARLAAAEVVCEAAVTALGLEFNGVGCACRKCEAVRDALQAWLRAKGE